MPTKRLRHPDGREAIVDVDSAGERHFRSQGFEDPSERKDREQGIESNRQTGGSRRSTAEQAAQQGADQKPKGGGA